MLSYESLNLEEKGYAAWRALVDQICQSRLLVTLADLPDYDFMSLFSDGYTPAEAFEEFSEENDLDEDFISDKLATMAEEYQEEFFNETFGPLIDDYTARFGF